MLIILMLFSLLYANEIKYSKNEVKTGEVFSFELYTKSDLAAEELKKIKIESTCLYFIINQIENRSQIVKINGDVVALNKCENNREIIINIANNKMSITSPSLNISNEGIEEKKLDQFIVIDSPYFEFKWWYVLLSALMFLLALTYWFYYKRNKKPEALSINDRLLKKINSAESITELKELYNVFQYVNIESKEREKLRNEIAEKLFSPHFNIEEKESIKDYFRKIVHD
jgi:hypothetical protein